MDSCEALGLTCVLYRDDEVSSLRRKLTAAHSRNYRLRKIAQLSAEKLKVERYSRSLMNEMLVSCFRRMDSLESAARIVDATPQSRGPLHVSADTLHQS